MKKQLFLLLAVLAALLLTACASSGSPAAETPAQEAPVQETPAQEAPELSLWVYPVGNWSDPGTVDAMMAKFEAATGIRVAVEYLDYNSGDERVNQAIGEKATPDLILEGPERLVANWGTRGCMVDIADLWDDTDRAEVNAACQAACFTADGVCYEYPVVMTAHCMAINYDAFVEAGADQYVDLDTHTWTTEQFISAVQALHEHFGGAVAAVFCQDQAGDQGTRALVNNLYGGSFTNAEHTAYTADSQENIRALELLKGLEGIRFDETINGTGEIGQFYREELKMAFCWNIAQQLNPNGAGTGESLTANGQVIEFMSFPSPTGESRLCGGIWGFGIFDNGDEARIEAAKTFIRYFCEGEGTADAVRAANYFAVRDTAGDIDLSGIWADNAVMKEYTKLMPRLGDYYQVAPNWTEARRAWWSMLQRIGGGGEVAAEVAAFDLEANGAA